MKAYKFLLNKEWEKFLDGSYELDVYVAIDDEVYSYSTGLYVLESEWDQTNQRIMNDSDGSRNEKLAKIAKQIDYLLYNGKQKNPCAYIDFEKIHARKTVTAKIADYFLHLIVTAEQHGRSDLALQYFETLTVLSNFDSRVVEKTFTFIGKLFLLDWDEWMRDVLPDEKRIEHVKTLRLCMYNAEREGKLPVSKNPFKGNGTELPMVTELFL